MPTMQSDRVSPAHAQYIVQRLVAERHVSPSEIAAYLAELPALITSLEARLASLRSIANGAATPNPTQASTRKAPARDQSWRALNGRYAGLVRQFPPATRTEYKRMSKENGKEFAIRRMREALGK